MLEIVQSGGWLMVPILLCSVIAAAISVERLWTLQRSRITPKNLLAQVWGSIKNDEFDAPKLRDLRATNPLGNLGHGIPGRANGVPTTTLWFLR